MNIKTKRITLIEACVELADRIGTEKGKLIEFKGLIKAMMIDALNYNQDILSYGTKSYFAQAIHTWRLHDPAQDTWLLPCLTDIKYSLMSVSERPMIHGIDDLVSDLTYQQLLREIELLV
jgi:hypothetical protein